MPEKRVVTQKCGVIDPGDIETSLANNGFAALAKARETMTPRTVIEEIIASGLRGRGGAGFPCGRKLSLAAAPGREKYLVCNADEGEMGTFKDRHLIENDPFGLVEGLAIAAYAIGTDRAFIYLRQEYHHLSGVIAKAIDQARAKGLLTDLTIKVQEGAGAYVCGEETALMNSIEGHRGESRFRPPFPPRQGLWDRPTIINNVETLMNLPAIIDRGAAWYAGLGTEQSKGTKVCCVSGDVARPGVYELVMGSPLAELVVDLAGAADVGLVLVGGAAGRIIPGDSLSTPLAYESALGSGAVMVFNRGRNVIELLSGLVEFMAEESCGKCAPCREGTQAMAEILGRLARAEGARGDIEALELLAETMMSSSLCGLGQGCPVPVLDGLEHYRADFENRINQSVLIRQMPTGGAEPATTISGAV